ncbi:MAG: GIY-YIG nuclease family protein [Vampirovibrio sp.]|nr:GIY-YIG nuclease family protein [Vampirovibrio sp.]
MNRQYFVYLMTTPANKVLYIGVTNHLARRIYEHREGMTPGFTKRYSVTKLVYFEIFNQPDLAIAREKQLKSWSRRRKNQLVESKNPHWEDLYKAILV